MSESSSAASKDHPFAALATALAAREAASLLRHPRILASPQAPQVCVDGKAYLCFSSNDYLGLASHPQLIAAAQAAAAQWGVGAGASHWVCGQQTPHALLSQQLAAWLNLPAAVLFSTGYMANLGALTALADRHTVLFCDKLNHASLNDAALLSRAKVCRFPHQDLATLAQLLQRETAAPRKIIVVDGVFSMDGDLAPLPDLLALAEQYDAWLYVDDAHGFGVLGAGGRGSLAHWQISSPRLIYMGTLGKAAGVSGAFVAGDAVMVAWVGQMARTHMFTTATPALLASTVLTSLRLLDEAQAARTHLRALIAQLQAGVTGLPWSLLPSTTPIQPLIIGDAAEAVAVSEALWAQGVWVNAIRPPTVPAQTARLRIALSSAHRHEEVACLLAALHTVAAMR